MPFMRIMRIFANMRMRMKISSTLSTYKYLPKIAIFWAKSGSALLCFQLRVPKISVLVIPVDFIQPQEHKFKVQNQKLCLKQVYLFYYFFAVDAHWCGCDWDANIGTWPSLIRIGIINLGHLRTVFDICPKKGCDFKGDLVP